MVPHSVRWTKAWLRRTYLALWAAAFWTLATVRGTRSAPARVGEEPTPRRILVIRLGLLGDGVLLTPTLRLLHQSFPEAEVAVLATPIQAPLLAPLPTVDRVHVWDAGDLLEPRLALQPWRWLAAARVIQILRRHRYDAALACYGPLASAIALLSGAPVRAGFAGEALPGSLTHAVPGARWEHPLHDAEYSVEVARAIGASGDTPRTELVLDPAADAAMERIWPRRSRSRNGAPLHDANTQRSAPATGKDRLAVLHLGATNGAAKRWPDQYWVELTSTLLAAGHAVALVGYGAREEALAGRIQREAAGSASTVIDLVGKTSTLELVAFADRADIFVSADSGPLHIAVALGRPVVALHGPTDPAINGPFLAQDAAILWHKLPCAPCYRLDRVADCPLGHTLCQRLLQPSDVYAAVRRAFAA